MQRGSEKKIMAPGQLISVLFPPSWGELVAYIKQRFKKSRKVWIMLGFHVLESFHVMAVIGRPWENFIGGVP